MIFSRSDRFQLRFVVFLLTIVTLFTVTCAYAQTPGFDKAPPAVINALTADQPQDVIVLLDDTAVISQTEIIQINKGLSPNSDEVLNFKAKGYGSLKDDILSSLTPGEIVILEDYSHLPMMFLKISSLNDFAQLVGHPGVLRVFENERYSHFLTQSLPLINQPAVAAAGKVGTGTTVAVLDTGVDYTRAAFGSCTAPGTPASCKVVYAQDFPPNDGYLDDNGHGTNVAGIVLGVAPDTRIAALDVFSNDGYAYSNYIIAAINWCITNKTTYNIVAMNMSLGGGSSPSLCPNDIFATPVENARNAGILSAIASGNNGYKDQISSPGCVPAAVSVGAVYDSTMGSQYWSVCTDLTTFADKVTCFSNSASFLTMLAPGSVITAAGISMSGTSQATPHIAGSIAVLKGAGAFPSDTPDQTVQRMTSTGVPITDTNGLTKPRIDLLAAVAGSGGTSYSISGTVTYGVSPLSGVTMTLSGGSSGTATTNASGNYTFTGLSNGSYTVTPGLAGYTFSPANRTIPVSSANVTGQNFTAQAVVIGNYSISGSVTSLGGIGGRTSPLSGVTMTLSGGSSGTATTNASGNYTFTGLSNGSYTVTPGLAGYTFSPANRAIPVSGANVTGQNFTGTYAGSATYTISGTVTSGGSPLSGVTMTLSGASSGTTTTDASGNYTFSGLANGSYTVIPARTGYSFNPVNRAVLISGANVTAQNFTASLAPTYSISGTVTFGGSPLSGVTMTLTGTASAVTTTDALGNYTFSGLVTGTYPVTPSRAGYTFIPSSRTVISISSNVTGLNFAAALAPTYSISGTVTFGASPLSGVTMTLSGASSGTTTTDASGNYTFTGRSNGSYTVTPAKTGYTFTPVNRAIPVSGANVTGQNFTAAKASGPGR